MLSDNLRGLSEAIHLAATKYKKSLWTKIRWLMSGIKDEIRLTARHEGTEGQ